MQHVHYPECSSTQALLIDKLKKEGEGAYIISTDKQTQGRGQHGKSWVNTDGALMFSFCLSPRKAITLTPLEVALLIQEFFVAKFNLLLKLKWVNDLLDSQNKKCGGILCQAYSSKIIAVGVGINLYQAPHLAGSEYEAGYLFKKNEIKDPISLIKNIVQYITGHRVLADADLIQKWERQCAHLNKNITIEDTKGIFLGIGKSGEAIIQRPDGEIVNIISGSLRF